MIHAAITAIGHFLPDYRMTNDELERLVDTSDAWIRSRTGIAQRHVAATGHTASHGAFSHCMHGTIWCTTRTSSSAGTPPVFRPDAAVSPSLSK